MNSDCIDLIYLDPPFNSGQEWSAPIGSAAAGAHFKDAWTLNDIDHAEHGLLAEKEPSVHQAIGAAKLTHGPSMMSYLIYMGVRLIEMRRILKNTASIFIHVDPTASHYVKILMDGIFGKAQYRNEIVWCYTGPGSPKMRQFNRKHDTIFWYSVGSKWTFNADAVRLPHKDGKPHAGGFAFGMDEDVAREYGKKGKIPETWWAQEPGNGLCIVARTKDYTGYPTQKPLALLDRIIRACSNKGDLVFDPFCGCATTLVSAHGLGREWIGCDLSDLAVKLVNKRIAEFRPLWGGAFTPDGPPVRSDIGKPHPNNEMKHILFGKQEGRCGGCRMEFPYKLFEIDHIDPKSKNGPDHIENRQLLCGHCNRVKATGTQSELIAKLKLQGIINPSTNAV